MAGNKSYADKIAELQKKQSQLKAQEKALRKRYSAEEHKKRTRRLIALGEVIENVLGRQTTDDDEKRLYSFLKKQESNGSYFSKAMNLALNQKENVKPINNGDTQ